MSGTGSTHRDLRGMYKFLIKKKRKGSLRKPDVEGGILLKEILNVDSG